MQNKSCNSSINDSFMQLGKLDIRIYTISLVDPENDEIISLLAFYVLWKVL